MEREKNTTVKKPDFKLTRLEELCFTMLAKNKEELKQLQQLFERQRAVRMSHQMPPSSST